MRLLKNRHHTDAEPTETGTDPSTDGTEGGDRTDRSDQADRSDRPAAGEPAPAPDTAAEPSTRRRWGRRTVTVPVTVPERSVRRTVTLPRRAVDDSAPRPGLSVAPVLAVGSGVVLAVLGLVALLRAGVDSTWFAPTVQVVEADHTALLGAMEIGAGVLLILAGLTGRRTPVAVLGLALAIAGTAVAVDPSEVRPELAIEQWWAWVLAAGGAVLTLSALHAPVARTSTRTTVDVT